MIISQPFVVSLLCCSVVCFFLRQTEVIFCVIGLSISSSSSGCRSSLCSVFCVLTLNVKSSLIHLWKETENEKSQTNSPFCLVSLGYCLQFYVLLI